MENANPKKLPRLRKTNFSQLEENILQTEVEKHYAVIKEKHSTSTTNLEKNRVWNNITNKINALGVANRTQKEVRDKWRNLTVKAKSVFTDHRREINKTGGGPALKKPSSSVERVVNMLQDTTSFSGIHGGIETASFECYPAANEESDDDAEIENAIVEQPDVNAVTPTRVPLSPRILVTNILPLNTNVELPASRPVTARSESTAENISVHSVNNIRKRRRVTQEDVFQMQVKVCKEQMELYSEQRRLVKEQTEKEKKQSQKVALQIQLLRKLNEDDNIPPTLTGSQVAYLAAMSSCFEDS
ncbi:myb/SANT-like DNA-binding domain-containing protein 4 [Mytilus edulis]|uniref:myb/SANT-like DNA-binding domain-containing protein 4 n=1 Tax=Mytilus edulis TaxID=6550 RepID=UPI0039EEFA66